MRGSGLAKCVGRVACSVGRAFGNVGLSAAQGMAQNDAAKVIKGGETGSLGTVTVLQALGVHIPHGQSSTVRANQNWRELQKFNTKKSFADLVNDPNLGRN